MAPADRPDSAAPHPDHSPRRDPLPGRNVAAFLGQRSAGMVEHGPRARGQPGPRRMRQRRPGAASQLPGEIGDRLVRFWRRILGGLSGRAGPGANRRLPGRTASAEAALDRARDARQFAGRTRCRPGQHGAREPLTGCARDPLAFGVGCHVARIGAKMPFNALPPFRAADRVIDLVSAADLLPGAIPDACERIDGCAERVRYRPTCAGAHVRQDAAVLRLAEYFFVRQFARLLHRSVRAAQPLGCRPAAPDVRQRALPGRRRRSRGLRRGTEHVVVGEFAGDGHYCAAP